MYSKHAVIRGYKGLVILAVVQHSQWSGQWPSPEHSELSRRWFSSKRYGDSRCHWHVVLTRASGRENGTYFCLALFHTNSVTPAVRQVNRQTPHRIRKINTNDSLQQQCGDVLATFATRIYLHVQALIPPTSGITSVGLDEWLREQLLGYTSTVDREKEYIYGCSWQCTGRETLPTCLPSPWV